MSTVLWPLLASLSSSDRGVLLAGAHRRRFPKGQAVFHEGDRGNALFLLERGHVAVRQSTQDGHEVTVVVLGPGASFGELALLDVNSERSAGTIALDAVEVLRIEASAFETLCGSDPAINRYLLTQLASSVRRVTTLYAEALHLPADKRVSRRLVELAVLYRTEGDPPVIRLTHDDLASIAGTSRQTVTDTVGRLAAAGVLSPRRGSLRIDDLDRLRFLAQ